MRSHCCTCSVSAAECCVSLKHQYCTFFVPPKYGMAQPSSTKTLLASKVLPRSVSTTLAISRKYFPLLTSCSSTLDARWIISWRNSRAPRAKHFSTAHLLPLISGASMPNNRTPRFVPNTSGMCGRSILIVSPSYTRCTVTFMNGVVASITGGAVGSAGADNSAGSFQLACAAIPTRMPTITQSCWARNPLDSAIIAAIPKGLCQYAAPFRRQCRVYDSRKTTNL
jgi:hypothetical protein